MLLLDDSNAGDPLEDVSVLAGNGGGESIQLVIKDGLLAKVRFELLCVFEWSCAHCVLTLTLFTNKQKVPHAGLLDVNLKIVPGSGGE